MSVKLLLVTAATLVSLVLGSVRGIPVSDQVPAGPADCAQQGRRAYGVIESGAGQTIALASPVGLVNLVADANTLLRIPGTEQPGLDDLATGDVVGALGWWDEDGRTFHAFVVARLEPDRLFPLGGELTAVSDDTLTIQTCHGTAAVHVDDETRYRVGAVEAPGLDDLEIGTMVVVSGTLNPDGSLLARGVAVPRAAGGRAVVRGRVASVESDGLVIETRQRGRVTAQVDEQTRYRIRGVDDPGLDDIKAGDPVIVRGTWNADGSLQAHGVAVLRGRGWHGGLRGEE
jgi:hypothetical protein